MTDTVSNSTGTRAADEFGRVEARGISFVPPAERHGRPRELFWIWAAANVNYLYVILGGILILLGLDLSQGLVVVLLGNLFWVPIGIMATSGPVSGTPSSVITRSMFGVRGNRVYMGLFNWPTFIAYEAINLSLGALAGFAFAEMIGVSANRPVQVLVVAVTAAVTLAISVYGHATIVRMSGVFTALLTLMMVGLGIYVVANADWGYAGDPEWPLAGWPLVATMLLGITIIASSPLSWGISADYARYLPVDSSRTAVATWTVLGGAIPAVLLASLGVLAGTVIDMSDPQTTLAEILPTWFYALFLLFVVLGSMTNNILTMYSSGLCLQAVGVRLSRAATVFIDGVLGVLLASYALFVADFTETLSTGLELSVALFGPFVGIYLVDLWLRRLRYDGQALHDESPSSPYWFSRGVNLAGFGALLAGTTSATLCLNTTFYVGPVATWLNQADLTSFVGPVVAIVTYVVLVRWLYPAHIREPAPAPVLAKSSVTP